MATKQRDKYDRAVSYFTEKPDEISDAFIHPDEHRHGCLFKFADTNCGCPILIKTMPLAYEAPTVAIKHAIISDQELPSQEDSTIRVQHLDRIAYWQRRMDAAIEKKNRRRVVAR